MDSDQQFMFSVSFLGEYMFPVWAAIIFLLQNPVTGNLTETEAI